MLRARATAERIDLTNGAKTAFSIRTEFSVSTGAHQSLLRRSYQQHEALGKQGHKEQRNTDQ